MSIDLSHTFYNLLCTLIHLMHISIITQRHSLSGFVIYHVSDPSILEQGKLGEDFFKYTLRFKRKYVNTQKNG